MLCDSNFLFHNRILSNKGGKARLLKKHLELDWSAQFYCIHDLLYNEDLTLGLKVLTDALDEHIRWQWCWGRPKWARVVLDSFHDRSKCHLGCLYHFENILIHESVRKNWRFLGVIYASYERVFKIHHLFCYVGHHFCHNVPDPRSWYQYRLRWAQHQIGFRLLSNLFMEQFS